MRHLPAAGRRVSKPSGVIRTISPGPRSRTGSTPMLARAQVSMVTAVPNGEVPRITGVRPCRSRAAQMPSPVSSRREHEPSIAFWALRMPASKLSSLLIRAATISAVSKERIDYGGKSSRGSRPVE